VSVPLHQQWGIEVVWHGQSLHDPDSYGLIRGFADLATLEATQAALYASDDWRAGPREGILSRIETATKIVIPMNEAAIESLRRKGSFEFMNGDRGG